MVKIFSVLMVAVFSMFFLSFPSEAPAPSSPCQNVVCPPDNNLCTQEYCDQTTGLCASEVVVECPPDDDLCTDEYCKEETGACVSVDNGTCEECPPAYPKTQGYWQRQCKALGLIGKSKGKLKLHEEWMATDLTREEQVEICANLKAISNDMCSKARKQLQALELNLMSERVAECNCVMAEGNIGDAIELIYGWIEDGECKDANYLADGINRGDMIIDCRID